VAAAISVTAAISLADISTAAAIAISTTATVVDSALRRFSVTTATTTPTAGGGLSIGVASGFATDVMAICRKLSGELHDCAARRLFASI
jgi:hypothetical protein